ncbi:YopX family protein [Paraliobacillus ryukyuensis]|uniref:YopX family protein n=1 Tax=Paraliobacillus ryukyuensis TaxID=200904 RepID=UPI0009A631BD|nr:YopX family protein [Paraliobacillus ryukyuensis]
MREIKFRVFDTELNKMIYEKNKIEIFDDMIGFRFQKHFEADIPIVMQYTGLKAWKDQEEDYKDELYDQDILYFTVFDMFDNDTQYTGFIDWSEIDACWIIKVIGSNQQEEYELGWVLQQDDEAKKIGTVYENPELLGVKS